MQLIAKLMNITYMSLWFMDVYGRYIYSWWDYKPPYNWGGTILYIIGVYWCCFCHSHGRSPVFSADVLIIRLDFRTHLYIAWCSLIGGFTHTCICHIHYRVEVSIPLKTHVFVTDVFFSGTSYRTSLCLNDDAFLIHPWPLPSDTLNMGIFHSCHSSHCSSFFQRLALP